MPSCLHLTYIGPGPGLAVQGPALLILIGWLVALMAILTLPLRLLLKRRKTRQGPRIKRLAVIGLDGLEPTRTERLMDEGKLPHLSALAKRGCYQRLGTTCPPLSPVAWATFSTGVNPGKHGIYDFLKREPDYQPSLAFSTVQRVRARWGPFRLPWMTEQPRFLRKSKSFWTVLAEHGVLSHVLRVPVTWPPERFDGLLLSAMGAPDLLGTQGTYTLFTNQTPTRELKHGEVVQMESRDETWLAPIQGPLGKTIQARYANGELSLQGESYTLSEQSYTPWIELRFGKISGLAKFLKLDHTSFYMTAIQIAPHRPSTPLSHPRAYSVALGKLLGPFATCGLAEDMGARDDRTLTLEAFLEQAYEIHDERERQFFHSLERTSQGLCLAVFDGTDRIQHMTVDEEDLDRLYQRMDDLVGRTAQRLQKESDALIVLSDHGFKPLHTLVDLNAWLAREGYLKTDSQGAIDWGRTRAYNLGLAGLSLNLKGREKSGVVEAAEADELLHELAARLKQLSDGESLPIKAVHLAKECYRGPYVDQAPDLVIGYHPGYGIYKDAARGKVGETVLVENDRPWVADHCFEPETVPGVLFSSLPLLGGSRLEDMAPTILELFGVRPPSFQEGRSLLC